jgi:hypothetical protein
MSSGLYPLNPHLTGVISMKVFKIVMLTLAVATGAAVAAQAGSDGDDCHSKSVHGLWDCR